MKLVILKSGHKMPALGLGTWQLQGEDAKKSVSYALEIGYRHIDTAEAYKNQKYVGAGIEESQTSREKIFVTSKVFHRHLTPNKIVESCKKTLEELKLNYLDLLLLHWPNPAVPMKEQLTALNSLKEKGLVKSIGVSNYTIRHLKEALDSGIEFDVNQIEFHPSLNQTELKQFCEDHNIAITAYSPIAQGQDLRLPEILEIAKKYQKTPSQIILNWIMSQGMVAIPRSVKKEHIKDNFGADDWELELSDIEKLKHLNSDNRIVSPPWSDFD